MIIKQLNSDANGTGGGTAPVNPFAAFSAESVIDLEEAPAITDEDEQEKTDKAEEAKALALAEQRLTDATKGMSDVDKAAFIEKENIAKAEAEKKPNLGDAKSVEATKEEERIAEAIKTFTPEQKASYEKGDINEKGEKVEKGFSTPGTETSEDGSWVDVAKAMGFEIKEDTFDAFKQAQEQYKETIKQEVEQKKFEEMVLDLPAKEQIIVRGLKAGLTMEQIEAPRKKIAELVGMSDADLLAADLTARGLKEDAIEYQISKLVETDKLELEVAPLRALLKTRQESMDADMLADVTAIETELKERKSTALEAEYKSLEKVANTIDDFMGTKLTKANKDYVLSKYKNGEYHDILTDHTKFINTLLYMEYGKEAQTNLINKALEDERSKAKTGLHNIPPIRGGAPQSVSKTKVGEQGKPSMATASAGEI